MGTQYSLEPCPKSTLYVPRGTLLRVAELWRDGGGSGNRTVEGVRTEGALGGNRSIPTRSIATHSSSTDYSTSSRLRTGCSSLPLARGERLPFQGQLEALAKRALHKAPTPKRQVHPASTSRKTPVHHLLRGLLKSAPCRPGSRS